MGDCRRFCVGAYDPVDHRWFFDVSRVYGADRTLGLGDGEARPRLWVLTCSGRLWGVARGEATGDNCMEDMSDVRFEAVER